MDIGINSSLTLATARATAGVASGTSTGKALPEDKKAAAEPAVAAQPARAPVEEAVSSIQNFVQTIRRDLNFSLDDSSGRVVVKVTDGVSGEVIRQLPTEEALRLAESLEEVRSLLFKAEA